MVSVAGTLTLTGGLDVAGTAGTTFTVLGGLDQVGSPSYVLTGPLTGTGTLEKAGSGVLILTPSIEQWFFGGNSCFAELRGRAAEFRPHSLEWRDWQSDNFHDGIGARPQWRHH